MPFSIRLIDRDTCARESFTLGRFAIVPEIQKYLDFGMISKYRKSGEICIDFNMANSSDHAVLATNVQNRVVGILKFDLEDDWLVSRGTWVSRNARRQGLAMKLWRKAIVEHKVRGVEVTAVSDRGKTLVDKLQRKFPKVSWAVADAGDRILRNLATR